MTNVNNSINVDSTGRKLTENQAERYKNSQAVDENGNLLTLYHGTSSAGFMEFKEGAIWMTTSIDDAMSYGGASKLS